MITEKEAEPGENAGVARRDLFRIAAALVALPLILPTMAAAETKPNILFILVDDLGWKDVGYHGSDMQNSEYGPTGANRRPAGAVLRSADVHTDARSSSDRSLPTSVMDCRQA